MNITIFCYAYSDITFYFVGDIVAFHIYTNDTMYKINN